MHALHACRVMDWAAAATQQHWGGTSSHSWVVGWPLWAAACNNQGLGLSRIEGKVQHCMPWNLPPISLQALPRGEAAAHAFMCLLSTLGCTPPLPLLPWLPATWSQLSSHSKLPPQGAQQQCYRFSSISAAASAVSLLPLQQYQCYRFSRISATASAGSVLPLKEYQCCASTALVLAWAVGATSILPNTHLWCG